MDNSALNKEHTANLAGFEWAIQCLDDLLIDNDLIYEGVFKLDNNHNLMIDTDEIHHNIIKLMSSEYNNYYDMLGDKEVEDENRHN